MRRAYCCFLTALLFSLDALRINRKLMASLAIRRVSNRHQGITISVQWWMMMLWIFATGITIRSIRIPTFYTCEPASKTATANDRQSHCRYADDLPALTILRGVILKWPRKHSPGFVFVLVPVIRPKGPAPRGLRTQPGVSTLGLMLNSKRENGGSWKHCLTA